MLAACHNLCRVEIANTHVEPTSSNPLAWQTTAFWGHFLLRPTELESERPPTKKRLKHWNLEMHWNAQWRDQCFLPYSAGSVDLVELLVQAFSHLQVKDYLWIPLTTCAPCGSGCFVSWLWLLCDQSTTFIFTRLPWMLTPRRSLTRWRRQRQTPRIPLFLVALSRRGTRNHGQSIRHRARAKVKQDARRGVTNANGVNQTGVVEKSSIRSRWRWSIEPMGEPLTPVQFSEICQSPVPVWRRLSGVSIQTLWRKV